VNISPGSGSNIQNAVNSHPAGTAFCLAPGTFNITSAITPKTGNSFTGTYGAVLDGSGWSTSDSTQGAFRAWNQDVDDVTIRNVVIRNMPQRAVSTIYGGPDRWIVDHNDLFACQVGLQHADFARVTNNSIHHNRQYGIVDYRSTGALIANNEIAFNNTISNWPGAMGGTKWVGASNLTIRGNFVHGNYHHGIWLDTTGSGHLIEDNLIADNTGMGIFYEASGGAVVRNNEIARNTGNGLYISNSHDVEAYGNRLILNRSMGVALFLDGNTGHDLRDNLVHDNFVDASDAVLFSTHLAASITCSNVTDGCVAVADTKNNRFVHNTYDIPNLTGGYFYFKGKHRTWSEWQTAGRDTTGGAI
jgi:parallel beta-helix repeat protein